MSAHLVPCPVCHGSRQVACHQPRRAIGPVIPCPACTDATALVHDLLTSRKDHTR